MTPDLSVDPIANPEIPSTAGMTTRVVKGSLWTLLGQVLPMAVALIATPFTIRFLGSEAYGVVILVGLIPMYFSFADFGMGIASTKFGSEAYGEGNRKKGRLNLLPKPSAAPAINCDAWRSPAT